MEVMNRKEIYIPTETEVRAAYREGEEAVVSLLRRVAETISRLADRIQSLEDRLAMNSSNSGKPPSGDGYNKPSPKSQRKRHKKQNGGQPEHKGNTLQMEKCREKLRLLTRRCRHGKLEDIAKELRVYLRGWIQYFYLADTPTPFETLNGWLRRRLRQLI